MKRFLLATIALLPMAAHANTFCAVPVSAPAEAGQPAPRIALPQPGSPPAVAARSTGALDSAVLRHIAAAGASIEDRGVRDGLRTVVARTGNEFMLLTVVPSGQAAVAGLPVDLSVQQLTSIAGAGLTDLGERHGMRTLLVRSGEQFQVFYAPPGGERVIPGVMWGPNGQNLTREHVSAVPGTIPTVVLGDAPAGTALLPTPGAPAQVRLASVVANATGGTIGAEGAPRVTVFVDPQCGYSVQALQRMQQHVAAGRVRLTVIPVAVLDDRNGGRSTTDSLGMLSRSAEQMVGAWSRGDLGGAPAPDAGERLRTNMQVAAEIGLRGTPTFVWQRPDGSEGRQDGLPSSLEAMLTSAAR